MILDSTLVFSDAQAVTTTAASTNVIDFSGVKKGEGIPLELRVAVQTTFADGTSIAVSVETDDNEAFSSATTVIATPAIATASLVAGYVFALNVLPAKLERYVRLKYTVVGTMTAGKLDAFIPANAQSNQVYQ